MELGNHFETMSSGLAIPINQENIGVMINNDRYSKSRLDLSAGTLVLFKQFTESLIVNPQTSGGSEEYVIIIETSSFPVEANHTYRLVFQCRSLTLKPGGTSIYLYYSWQYSGGLGGGGTVGPYSNLYTSGFGYGPIKFEESISSTLDEDYSFSIGFLMPVDGVAAAGQDAELDLDSSEGAYAYFAVYDEGVL